MNDRISTGSFDLNDFLEVISDEEDSKDRAQRLTDNVNSARNTRF